MAIDTPATIAILGAGPIGLEAALYARYLGYDVMLFERGKVAAEVRRWGHLPMVTPFGTCVSKLGLAALHAQDPTWRPPPLNAAVTGEAWRDAYLLPLAQSDLIADGLREHTEVATIRVAPIARRLDRANDAEEAREEEDVDDAANEPGFRLLVRNTKNDASPDEVSADVVIDATGASGRWGWLSGTDLPLPGEVAAADAIQLGPPDWRGRERAKYAGRKTLLVGGGMGALATLTALNLLADSESGTEVIWISAPPEDAPADAAEDAAETSRPPTVAPFGNRIHDGAKFAATIANRSSRLRHWPGASIKSLLIAGAGTVQVRFDAALQAEMAFDRIINCRRFQAGALAFWGLPIQVGPTAETTPAGRPGEPPDIAAGHVESIYAQIGQELITSQPNFYVLGTKRFARRKDWFTVGEGLDQIRALFSILGDRPSLDLYATMDKLLP